MSQLVALSVSIGVLGGIATFLFLNSGLLIWAAFVAWACFFHSGGDTNGLRNTIVGNVFGAFCAWLAAVILLSVPLGGTLGLPLWAAIVVGVTVLGMCLAAHIKAFSVIPASVYGYAATFAFLLQTAGMLNKDKLLSASLQNGLVVVALSMVIGALFGFASGKVGALLAK
jgi:hypothetical protein